MFVNLIKTGSYILFSAKLQRYMRICIFMEQNKQRTTYIYTSIVYAHELQIRTFIHLSNINIKSLELIYLIHFASIDNQPSN